MQSSCFFSLLSLTNILYCVRWVKPLGEPAWCCPTGAWHAPVLLMGCHEFSVWDPDTGSRACHHGREHHSAMRSGLQNLLLCVGKVPPRFCVWTVRKPHCGNVGACPMITCYGKKASKPFCLLGIWKREKSYGYLLTPEGSKKPYECGREYYLGILWVTFIFQI